MTGFPGSPGYHFRRMQNVHQRNMDNMRLAQSQSSSSSSTNWANDIMARQRVDNEIREANNRAANAAASARAREEMYQRSRDNEFKREQGSRYTNTVDTAATVGMFAALAGYGQHEEVVEEQIEDEHGEKKTVTKTVRKGEVSPGSVAKAWFIMRVVPFVFFMVLAFGILALMVAGEK